MNILEKINNYDVVIDYEIDIVYSILVHENIECIYDMIYNICYFNKYNKYLIVIHSNLYIYEIIKKTHLPKFVIINPNPYEKQKYTYSILKGHIDNFLLVKNLNYKIFCLLASNCMIVKHIDINYLYKNSSELSSYTQKYEDLKEITNNKSEFLKNLSLIELFKDKNICIKMEFHEGSYYKKNVFESIINFINENNIENKITSEFVAEEILLASIENYITNKITDRICKFSIGSLPRQRDIDNIINSKKYYIIKKVPRIINHRVRLLINKLYV